MHTGDNKQHTRTRAAYLRPVRVRDDALDGLALMLLGRQLVLVALRRLHEHLLRRVVVDERQQFRRQRRAARVVAKRLLRQPGA